MRFTRMQLKYQYQILKIFYILSFLNKKYYLKILHHRRTSTKLEKNHKSRQEFISNQEIRTSILKYCKTHAARDKQSMPRQERVRTNE